jgi:guanylate cyclase
VTFTVINVHVLLQVRFRLDFDNSEYMAGEARRRGRLGMDATQLPAVPGNLLLRLFPFGVMINRELKVVAAGEKLQWRGRTRVTGSLFASLFRLRRPKVELDWRTVSTNISRFILGNHMLL